MEFDCAKLSEQEGYRLLIGSVVPRPIAWITTLSEHGLVNLAPFSGFTFVSSKPPMVAVSIGRREGSLKDTARNMLRERELVVHIADMPLIEPLHRSSFAYPEWDSEVAELGLTVLSSKKVRTPRLADAPIAMECRVETVIECGEDKVQLFVVRVEMFHVRDSLLSNGKIDSFALNPIARLGGPHYANLDRPITFGRNGLLEPDSRGPDAETLGGVRDAEKAIQWSSCLNPTMEEDP